MELQLALLSPRPVSIFAFTVSRCLYFDTFSVFGACATTLFISCCICWCCFQWAFRRFLILSVSSAVGPFDLLLPLLSLLFCGSLFFRVLRRPLLIWSKSYCDLSRKLWYSSILVRFDRPFSSLFSRGYMRSKPPRRSYSSLFLCLSHSTRLSSFYS